MGELSGACLIYPGSWLISPFRCTPYLIHIFFWFSLHASQTSRCRVADAIVSVPTLMDRLGRELQAGSALSYQLMLAARYQSGINPACLTGCFKHSTNEQ